MIRRLPMSTTLAALLVLGPAWSINAARAQSSMRGVNSSNDGNCPPGQNCDPCDTASIGSGIAGDVGRRNPVVQPGSNVSLPVPRLKIAYTATWVVVPGSNPLAVNYRVVPTVQNIGSAPWSAPLTLSLVDSRTAADNTTEDPLFDATTGGVVSPHLQASFASLPVTTQIAVGQTVLPDPLGWTATVEWFRGPDLYINGAGLSCPVTVPTWTKLVQAPRPSASPQ